MIKKLLLPILLLTLVACNSGGVQSTPESVIQTVLDAAKSKNFETLKNLCTPQAARGAKIICKVPDSRPRIQGFFAQAFSKTTIKGKAEINGDRAIVTTLGGLKDNQELKFELVKQDGKWYLAFI
ncbi:MAG: DUF4878 domain-containing protein [Acaryochloris sp. RU_4_1]|nr:DUF4878 domain-containing protein [Acaryochloris sp. RU_4_1]NJR56236.1 DUF4878 domain-containing protein [Acaryochloris sp. CRU_2_0]